MIPREVYNFFFRSGETVIIYKSRANLKTSTSTQPLVPQCVDFVIGFSFFFFNQNPILICFLIEFCLEFEKGGTRLNDPWSLKVARRSLVVVVVVVNPYCTKHLSVTALKTSDLPVESRSSDLLLTPTAFGSHPEIFQLLT
uniref:Uncharacterized protein n=1 Tax=Salix viminalis TaxID=40686 RepID=A0A6N2LHQ1_SALVM